MGALFSKPEQPKVADPVRMPVPDDAATRLAKARELESIKNRSGRAQTILSRRGAADGAGAYTNSLLGSGT